MKYLLQFFNSLLFFNVFMFPLVGEVDTSKIQFNNCPKWIKKQIDQDLKFFQDVDLSSRELDKIFKESPPNLFFVKFKIQNNLVSFEKHFEHASIDERIESFLSAFNYLCSMVEMPNLQFVIFMHDGLIGSDSRYEQFPLFVMSRAIGNTNGILIPDYEALNSKYQVIDGIDVTSCSYNWNKKEEKLIWRGSADQSSYNNSTNVMTNENINLFSRVRLCELALEFPEYIDSKLTIWRSEYDCITYLNNFLGERLSYEDMFKYKYQILIHGNAASFGRSGWRFFSNSVVFIPDFQWTQWYYAELKPYIHYLPVSSDLNNLVVMILWAQKNDDLAKKIARDSKIFAKKHLSYESQLTYLYFLLKEYSKLRFVD